MSGAILLILPACRSVKVTYPQARLTQALEQICRSEYNLPVGAHRAGATLQVFTWAQGGLLRSGQAEMTEESSKTLQNMLLAALRVALSTDAKLEFLQVQVADLKTGAKVTLVRYVPDVKGSLYESLPEGEYLNRLVVEIDPDANEEPDPAGYPHWGPPMTMERFLAMQVAVRLRRSSFLGIRASAAADLASQLLVVEVQNWETLTKKGEKMRKRLLEEVRRISRQVIEGYHYNGFREVALQDAAGRVISAWAL